MRYKLFSKTEFAPGFVDLSTELWFSFSSGVAGWGGDAGTDSNGRPMILVMGLSVPQTAAERASYDHRQIVLHELVHGLGFGMFLHLKYKITHFYTKFIVFNTKFIFFIRYLELSEHFQR